VALRLGVAVVGAVQAAAGEAVAGWSAAEAVEAAGRQSAARPSPLREEEAEWRCPGLEAVDRLGAVLRRAAAILRGAAGTCRRAGSTPMVTSAVARS
jgi:hypothetical protein